MANTNKKGSDFKLTPDMKRRLTEIAPDLKQARHVIGVLQEIGMDTTELETKLADLEKTRDVLLREFGS